MPVNYFNKDFDHVNVFKYNGIADMARLIDMLNSVKERPCGKELKGSPIMPYIKQEIVKSLRLC